VIRRLLLAFALTLTALFAIVAGLLSTTSGMRWLAARASAYEPRLSITVVDGNAWRGLSVADLKWSDHGLHIRIPRAEFRWRPLCLLDGELCIDRVAASGARIDLPDSGEAASEAQSPTSPPQRIVLPVGIRLGSLRVRDAELRTGSTTVAVNDLRGRADFYGSHLRVERLRVSGVDVELPEASEEATNTAGEPGKTPVKLPTVMLPVDLDLSDFRLEQAVVSRGGQSWSLDELSTSASWRGSRLDLDRLRIRSPRGRASLRGDVDLAGDYPLNLSLDAYVPDAAQGQDAHFTVELSDSVASLKARVDIRQPLAATVNAEAKPLAQGLPYQLHVNVPAIGYPLPDGNQIGVSQLEAGASGDLQGYHFTASAAVGGADIPQGDWSVAGSGDWSAVRIDSLVGRTLGGRLDANGRVAWQDGLKWSAALKVAGIDPGRYRKDLPGEISGEVSTSGGAADGKVQFTVDVAGIRGRLRGYDVAASGSVERGADDAWHFRKVDLRSGPNRLQAGGSLSNGAWDATASLDLPELNALWPGLGGQLNGRLAVSGPMTEPDVTVDLSGREVSYNDVAVGSLGVKGRIAGLLQAPSEFTLKAEALSSGDRDLGSVVMRASGTVGSHSVSLDARGGPLSGRLGIRGGLEADTTAWNGRLTKGELDLPDGTWRLDAPVRVAWEPEQRRLRIAGHCWQRSDASLCSDDPLLAGPAVLQARLTLKGYQLSWLQPWMPEGLSAQGPLGADITARWSGKGLPAADVRVNSDGGRLTLATDPEREDLDLPFRSLELQARLRPERASARFRLESQAIGTAAAELNLDPRTNPRTLDGKVSVSGFGLAVLAPFFPKLRSLEGEVAADGTIGGTLREPSLKGTLTLSDAQVGLTGSPMEFRDINLEATLRGNEVELTGGFRSGAGKANVGGTASWQDGPHATIAIVGDGLAVAYPPIVDVNVSPAVTLTVVPGEVAVNGRVNIPSGRLKLEKLPDQAVPYSEDVVVVNKNEPAPTESQPWQITTNIYLVLGDKVRFEGLGAQGRLTGSLKLRQIGAGGAEANGDIALEDGRFEAYGTKLEIRRGRLIFAGPVSLPQVDIEAVREVENVTVGLRVSGRADQPEVTLFSEPSMPQQQILTYLITGRPPGAGTPGKDAAMAQAALSLGVLGGRQVGEKVAQELGVEDFQLETAGQGEESQVAVSGYIAPNLMVRYGVGVFQPENTITLRYYLRKNLYMEAVSGLSSALDIFYSFDF
jgi:translocation and assembly module TamB